MLGPVTNVRLLMSRGLHLPLLTVWVGRVTIDILPDDVLLHIFYFDGQEDVNREWNPSWHRLVHVCRRWRSLVFASPNFLDLRLVFDRGTRVELASIWPPLPITIRNLTDWPFPEIDTPITYRNRIREINVRLSSSSQMLRMVLAMQETFPALIHLKLGSYLNQDIPVLPDDFLGGSAAQLQSLELDRISFSALPTFLLSATDLVDLVLRDVPYLYTPETLVTCLAVLPNLKYFTIRFHPTLLSHPDRKRRHLPPPTRIVLPSLIDFTFVWVSEYLEDLVSRIDTPLLDSIDIIFFYELIFDHPQLGRFLRRTPRFQTLNEAHVDFGFVRHVQTVRIQDTPFPPRCTYDRKPGLRITCHRLIWRLSVIADILASFFSSIYVVEHLYIYEPQDFLTHWEVKIKDMQWLKMFHPFPAVKNLYLQNEISQCIAPVLQALVGEKVMDVLPVLESISLEGLESSGPVQEAIGKFVAARQALGRPVAVSHWN